MIKDSLTTKRHNQTTKVTGQKEKSWSSRQLYIFKL